MIIIMGVAGSGKSLQGKLFVEDSGYRWVSMGELFRSHLSEERKKELLSGKLINDEEAIELLSKNLFDNKNTQDAVLEGFPRTIAQAEWILEQVKNGKMHIEAVFALKISKEVVTARLFERGRDDDSEEAINKRFSEYENKTLPILDYFKDEGVKVYDINADQSPESVHSDMRKYLS